jgi:hypothetical protein
MAKRFKESKDKNNNSKFKVEEPKDYNNKPILFSLEKVVSGEYCFSSLKDIDKKQFAESIFKRRNMTWNDANSAGKHALGFEMIPRNAIKVSIPKFITEDQKKFIVFRFNGKKPMIGYRKKNIFYVLWFDNDYSAYKHSNS